MFKSFCKMKLKLIIISTVLLLPSISMSEVPSSQRAEIAIASLKPTLESELKDKELQYGSPLYIRIYKESKEFEIWVKKGIKFEYFKTYTIANYGGGSLGPKLKEGDRQAPEGFYSITPQSMNPWSKFHLAFDLGFPNQYDRDNGRTGGAILIHGETLFDWLLCDDKSHY
jgi:murein L,D-transpeptidase YafK